jgi:hypothetical protein
LEIMEKLAKKYRIQTFDQEPEAAVLPQRRLAQLQLS